MEFDQHYELLPPDDLLSFTGHDEDTEWLEVHIPRKWLFQARDLRNQAFRVGIFFWAHAGEKGEVEFKLNRSLVSSIGLGRSTRSRAIKQLEAAGLIVVERPRSGYPTIRLVVEPDEKG